MTNRLLKSSRSRPPFVSQNSRQQKKLHQIAVYITLQYIASQLGREQKQTLSQQEKAQLELAKLSKDIGSKSG